MKKIIVLMFLGLSLFGCATQKKVSDYELQEKLKTKDPDGIKLLIERLQAREDKDKLLDELNLAIAYMYNGEYKKSNGIFQIIKEKHDYLRLSNGEAVNKYLLGDQYNKFQLNPSDYLYVCLFSSINNMALNDYQNAKAELKSCVPVFDYLVKYSKNPKQYSYYSYFLGLAHEFTGDFSNALLYYKKTKELNPDIPFTDNDITINQEYLKKGIGDNEVLILSLSGMGPYKEAHPNSHSVPVYKTRMDLLQYEMMGYNNQKIGEGFKILDIGEQMVERQKELYKELMVKSMTSDVIRGAVMAPVDVMTGGVTLIARLVGTTGLDGDFRYWDFVFNSITINRVKTYPEKGFIALKSINGEIKLIPVDTRKKYKELVLIKSFNQSISQ